MYSLLLGNFSSFTTVLQEVIEPFGYSDVDSSILGSVLVAVGIAGSMGFSKVVERKQNYKQMLILCCVGSFISIAWIGVTLHFGMNMLLMAIGICTVGVSFLATWPLTFELACELAFPVGEAATIGLMITGGQIVGVI
jgi:FLVCR family MFS transporter 7